MDVTFTTAVILLTWTVAVATENGSPPKFQTPAANRWRHTHKYIRSGASMNISCKANGDPKPEYQWKFVDRFTGKTNDVENTAKLHYSPEHGNLTVTELFDEDGEEQFACVASNAYGSIMTPPITLVRGVTAPFPGQINQDPEIVEAFLSEYIKLDCKGYEKLTDKPKSQIVWQRGRTIDRVSVMIDKENIAVDPTGVLHFLWVDGDDFNYVYVCSTYNHQLLTRNTNTHSYKLIQVTGNETPRNPKVVFAEDIIAMAGSNAKLTCLFSYFSVSSERLKITWFHEGQVVGEGRELTISAVLPTVQTYTSREYICNATLESSKTIASVQLKITSPPVFIPGKEMSYLTVVENKDAVFRCGTSSYGSVQDSPVWYVNTKAVVDNIKRFVISADRTMLTIHDVSLSDQKCVQCSVKNQYGMTFGTGCLTAIEKITITVRPLEIYNVRPGMHLNVSVDATTDSRFEHVLKYKWLTQRTRGDIGQGYIELKSSKGFQISPSGKQLAIAVPGAIEGDTSIKTKEEDISRSGTLRLAVNISHPYDYEIIKFAINVEDKTTSGIPITAIPPADRKSPGNTAVLTSASPILAIMTAVTGVASYSVASGRIPA